MKTSRRLLLLLSLVPVGACAEKKPLPKLPPPPVVVSKPESRPHAATFQAVGTTAAANFVEVRARVPGFLQSVEFTPGTEVTNGQLLFRIEPDSYASAVEAAKADLATADAELAKTTADLARVEKAAETNAVSKMEVDQRRAAAQQAAARVQAAKAKVAEAELQLSYTEIRAPIDGRVGVQQVDVGNLVGAPGTPNLLTTIADSRPIYVYFDVPERLLVGRLREIRTRPVDEQDMRPTLKIALQVEGDEGFPHEGAIDFVDNEVNSKTGTIRVRGILSNDNGLLVPGLFVRIRVIANETQDALFVEEVGIGTDLAGKFVMTVAEDGTAARVGIEVGDSVGSQRLVVSGLTKDTVYIVDGLAKARAGMKVAPKPAGASAGSNAPATGDEGR